MERIFFSTKAGTLDALNGVIKNARIPASIFFTSEAWKLDPKNCLKRIKDHLGKGSFAVRSSSQTEDTEKHSQAGKFLSVLDVPFGNLTREIKLVFASYDNINDDNEVLIQPMLNDVTLSGVAFSHDPNTCSPYRIINYSEDKDTTSITGGKSTGFTWQQASLSPTSSPVKLIPIIKLIDELLKVFDYQPLDIEFCFTLGEPGGLPWLLQARPLILSRVPETQYEQSSRLRALEQALKHSMRKHPWVTGCKTVFGVMPDWNPAEIIGIRPRSLALSLYKELITDNIWAYQRHNYGYRNLRSFPLLVDFSGLPYIDVRLSFNSFIPSTLNDDLSEKLVDYYVDRLLDSPNLHDKIEFDIVFSCYTFDSNKRLKALAAYNFSDSQIRQINNNLKTITKNIFSSKPGIWHKDLEKVNMLEQRRSELFKADLNPIEMVYWLIEDAKRYGSLPFAGLARAAFMAVQILKSLVTIGVFSEHDYDDFMLSVKTVSRQLTEEKSALKRDEFIAKYGHLRPGTYEITSLRYDEDPDIYFDWNNRHKSLSQTSCFQLSTEQKHSINRLLKEDDFDLDSEMLLTFLRDAIERREWAKFHFTHNLSDALSIIKTYGESMGFSAEDLSYCDYKIIKGIYTSPIDHKETFHNTIIQGKQKYAATLKTSLPPLIRVPEDIWAFHLPLETPNFITQKIVIGPIATIDSGDTFNGKIICIPNGDPGFDWLFSIPIAGLITAWGGVNSHMAIRAGELGLPAVIGAGETNYKHWLSADLIKIDCPNKRVEIIS